MVTRRRFQSLTVVTVVLAVALRLDEVAKQQSRSVTVVYYGTLVLASSPTREKLFKAEDLDELIRHETSKSQTSSRELNSPRTQNDIQKILPAYSKVEVQKNCTATFSNQSHVGASEPGRQVFTSTYHINYNNLGSKNENYEPYTHHSVAKKYHWQSTTPNRLEMESEMTNVQSPSFAVSPISTQGGDTGAHRTLYIKRKVLRKVKGQVHVFDESTYSEDSGAVSGLEERLGDLHVSMSANHDSELERTDTDSISDSFEADGLPSAFEAYIKGMVRSQSENDIRPRAKSFIRPLMDHPHTRHLKKTDPVAKYFQYKQDWEMFKPPGQKERKALHWKIRDQLSYQPPPPKPQKIFVVNSYVVPTEKKRSALRWEVRHDMANGLLPPKVNYRL
ncbi:hydrolethalus syndrome protein 1 isoform X4 [Hypomesus transpacificus]|uniref:hydrolethalus syndrome protein 1 isoform X4 n=1 Tax=Hypomesus transpacificus TaxID=137520 RepID=UPI001F085A8A|nr:hydrolethalus syndrome protein 1 isoform X4 [Hypomesus transpacificus]